MQKKSRTAVLLLLMSTLIPVSLSYATDINTGIDGYVTCEGVGVEGITINLYLNSVLVATTTTDVNGYYIFTNLDGISTYEVEAETPGDTQTDEAISECGVIKRVDFCYCPPSTGLSPGFWKGRCRQYLKKGTFKDYNLLALIAEMPADYNTWLIQKFLDEFTKGNNKDGYKTFLANLFNEAAELDPWED